MRLHVLLASCLFALSLVALDADFSSLTETALAMTIFRDEGKYLCLPSLLYTIQTILRPLRRKAC